MLLKVKDALKDIQLFESIQNTEPASANNFVEKMFLTLEDIGDYLIRFVNEAQPFCGIPVDIKIALTEVILVQQQLNTLLAHVRLMMLHPETSWISGFG